MISVDLDSADNDESPTVLIGTEAGKVVARIPIVVLR